MKYKLIATDLDGTLNNDSFQITEDNAKAIKKALDTGIKVVICSGRSPSSLYSYEAFLGLNTQGNYGIGFNGSTVYESDSKKVIFKESIEKELAVKIINTIRSIDENARLSVYLENDHLISDKGLEEILAQYNTDGQVKIDFYPKITDDLIKKDVQNMYCIDYRPKLLEIYEGLKKNDITGCTMAFTQENLLEFLPVSMNKAHGLRKLCKHLGISLNQVVAVGDNYNDIEMLQASGFAIAVANAVPQVKDVADYVTKRDNNTHSMVEIVDLIIKENKKL